MRLDASLFTDDARFAALPDHLKVAYLGLAALGASTDPPGTWRDPWHAEESLPRWLAEAIPPLAEAGMLALGADETVTLRRRDFYAAEPDEAGQARRWRLRRVSSVTQLQADGHGTGGDVDRPAARRPRSAGSVEREAG